MKKATKKIRIGDGKKVPKTRPISLNSTLNGIIRDGSTLAYTVMQNIRASSATKYLRSRLGKRSWRTRKLVSSAFPKNMGKKIAKETVTIAKKTTTVPSVTTCHPP